MWRILQSSQAEKSMFMNRHLKWDGRAARETRLRERAKWGDVKAQDYCLDHPLAAD